MNLYFCINRNTDFCFIKKGKRMRVRLSAHLPRHRSLHSCAPCAAPRGQFLLAVLASASLIVPATLSRKQPRPLRAEEEKERVARVRATSAPSLAALSPSRKQALPIISLLFSSGVDTPLSSFPRGLLSLGESPRGKLHEGRFQLQGKAR